VEVQLVVTLTLLVVKEQTVWIMTMCQLAQTTVPLLAQVVLHFGVAVVVVVFLLLTHKVAVLMVLAAVAMVLPTPMVLVLENRAL
jgi:hypothetical protein